MCSKIQSHLHEIPAASAYTDVNIMYKAMGSQEFPGSLFSMIRHFLANEFSKAHTKSWGP